MRNLINKSFSIFKNNLIFLQPIFIYFLMLMIALNSLHAKNMHLYSKILMMTSVFLCALVTITGLFYINKRAISEYNREDSKIEIAQKSIKNYKMFFQGIGKYFLKIFSGTLLYVLIFTLLMYLIGQYITQTIGSAPIAEFIEASKNFNTAQEMILYANSLSKNDIYVMNIWSLFFVLSSAIFYYVGILYTTILIKEKTNIIISLFNTITFLVKNLLKSIIIMIFMFITYLVINLMTLMLGANSIAFGILTILIAMYLNYYIILVMCFYNERRKADSNNGGKCIGEK